MADDKLQRTDNKTRSSVPPSPEAEYRLRVIVWLAMSFSIATYYVIVRMVPPTSPGDNPTLVNALLVVSAGLTAASFVVKRYFFKRALVRIGELVAFALCDGAALLGLLVWFLTASPQYSWFLIMGAAGQLLHFPRSVE